MTTSPVDTCPAARHLIDDPYRAMAAAEALAAAGYPQYIHPVTSSRGVRYCMHDLDATPAAARGTCPPGHYRTRDKTLIDRALASHASGHHVIANRLVWVCIHPAATP